MSDLDVTLKALREAVDLAPDNHALVQHYIRTLLDLTRYDEAESCLSDLLSIRSGQRELQLLQAEVFYRQGKNSHAMAIVETISGDFLPAQVLMARLLYRAGEVQRAVQVYRLAVDQDERLADPAFASLLGIGMDWDEEAEDDEVGEAAEVVEGRIRQAVGETDGGQPDREVEKPKVRFEDVGGMEAVKEQIRVKIIYPVTHADMYAAYGKQVGGGILMFGPPGCGKTYLARATAGEVDAAFLSIGINDVLDMWIGNSERNLHEFFEQARRNRPCVVFFDEVDALGASRSDMRQSAGRHLVNQFLAELDGLESDNQGLLILGATNAPWHIDSAFRRPGRFDRVLFVPPPDAAAREEILRIKLAGKPVDDVNIAKIAARTKDFSGADLQAVVDTAIEGKLQQAIQTGKPTPLKTADLLNVLKQVRPTTREWFASARNHALYANQGGVYDEILEYLNLK